MEIGILLLDFVQPPVPPQPKFADNPMDLQPGLLCINVERYQSSNCFY